MIHIGGTAIPIKSLPNVLQDVVESVKRHENPEQILVRFAPDIVPILLSASNVAIPYSGLAIAGIVIMLEQSKPPTKADEQRMWDQAQGLH